MTEGSVVFLIAKLTKFLQNEGTLLSEVRDDAEYITVELEFMKAFLRVAEAMEDSDPQLKVFAKNVRYLVYDLEDALDDFMFRLTHDYGKGFIASLHQISHAVTTLKARHQIAQKIKRIKTRVAAISEAHRRYLIRNNTMGQSSSLTRERTLPRGRRPPVFDEAHLVGIEHPKKMIIEWLFEDRPERGVVSVVGMGGLGKTTLVTQVYNNKEVKKHFEFRAWITLSQSFTTEDLLKDIGLQLKQVLRISDPQGAYNEDNDEMGTLIHEFLQERRYLIIFDDMSDTRAWDDFERLLQDNRLGSRILITTRNHDVTFASSPDKVHHMSPLSQEESWILFCRKIFHDSVCPPHLKEVLETILARCRGNPLAIVAIAGVLAMKDRNRIHEWESVHRTLGITLENDDRLKSILSLSYNDLPYYLKYCLLYFSVFPVGSPIGHNRLVRLWIAEGFVKETEGMTIEEVAEGYLNELIKRSLVEVVEATSDGRIKTCRVHDFLLQIINLTSEDQGFATIASEHKMVWPDKVRRLSVHDNVIPNMQERISSSHLRSLLLFGDIEYFTRSLLNMSSRRLRLLNVLDLEGTPLTNFPNEVFSLYLLKYLSLRRTKVRFVPSSISKLKNLETLDLKHTYVTSLPSAIVKLSKLSHLLIYHYEIDPRYQIYSKHGFMVPAQLGSLQFLQKLCFVEANQGNNLIVELGKLNRLRRLGIVKLRTEDGRALCDSIERMRNLRVLSVTALENEIMDLENLSSPPRFLQRLYLNGHIEKLPEWIPSVNSLIKLVLRFSGLAQDPLALLQHLPNLVHLELVQVYDAESLCFQANGFQKLKVLDLNLLDKLKTIEIEVGSMPCLENLVVRSCGLLKTVPLGIENLSELKVLEFFNMPLDFMMALHPSGREYERVKSVAEVYFTYWYDGNWDIISLESVKQGKNSNQPRPRPRHIWK